MRIKVSDNGNLDHAKILTERISERIPLENAEGGMTVRLEIDEKTGAAESYKIFRNGEEWVIAGADTLGLYFGIGKFLHSAKWSEEEFIPKETDSVIAPKGYFRAVYIAKHFSNIYDVAPLEFIERYIDDLLLWGHNTVTCIIPKHGDEESFLKSAEAIKKILRKAKQRGMKTAASMSANQGMEDAPHEFDAAPVRNLWFDGNAGRNLCLSKPGALDYMRKMWRKFLEQYQEVGLDYIITWPYDEGGCGCDECFPWGANKYLESCKAIREEALKYLPNVKFIISTWLFDCVDDIGEYEGLYKRLKTDMSWADYIMVDDHNDFPEYPLKHEVIKPIVNFPEISMYGLYPWGGFGAQPLPNRFQRIWDSSKHMVSSGEPYSEGIYEDISKVQCVAYYWNPEIKWQEILSEYVNYEFASNDEVIRDALLLTELIEKNHVGVAEVNEPEMAAAKKAKEISEKINAALSEKAKTAWRWRILYIRAQLDFIRYTAYMEKTDRSKKALENMIDYSGDLIVQNKEAQDFLNELCDIYFCVPQNGYNLWTHPPVGGVVPRSEFAF